MTDITHYYTERGEGEPLILLHGNGEDSSYFSAQITAFSACRRVIALDTRGHGKTPRGEKPFTIRQFADDLADFMAVRGIAAADLLGFSDGANIAMVFALKYPEKTKKLILNGGNLDPKGVKKRAQIPIEWGFRFAGLFASKKETAAAKRELLGLMVNDPFIEAAELAAIKKKTLVIAGTRDLIKAEHTRLIAGSIPGAELAFIKGGHFIAARNPDAFNARVLNFLNQ